MNRYVGQQTYELAVVEEIGALLHVQGSEGQAGKRGKTT